MNDTQAAPVNLLGMSLHSLQAFFAQWGEKPFRAVQVIKWMHQRGVAEFAQMTDISQSLRLRLQAVACIQAPQVVYQQDSADGTRKWIMQVEGGSRIEVVFIPESGRGTLCVSSQVGCALDCSFCSTGKQGFQRNLSASEIIGQLWQANRSLQQSNNNALRVTNVVMMGMGEPLLNFDAVCEALSLMMEDNAYGLSKRRVTVSTAGVVPAIDQLGQGLDPSLAVSLHAPTDDLRNQLVPLNKKYDIASLLAACQRYLQRLQDKRVITIEYTLIDQINDEPEHAQALATLLSSLPCKINLIPFNPFAHSGYRRPSNNRVHRFKQQLLQAGYNVTVRKTRGDDIDAACGQLVGQVQDITRRSERFIRWVEQGKTAAATVTCTE